MTVGDLKRELLNWEDDDKIMVRTIYRPYVNYKMKRTEAFVYPKDRSRGETNPRCVLVLIGEEESRHV